VLLLKIDQKNALYIQAGGELIGVGNIEVSIIKKAISFYC